MKLRIALAALALVASAVLAGAAFWHARPVAKPDPAALALFARTMPDADGVQRALSAWQGKLLIVNFWATWCGPCAEEMPQLQRVADEYAVRNVAVVGIGIDDADKIRQFRSEHHLAFPLLVDGATGMQLAQQLGNPEPVLPYTALISPHGQILEEHVGRIEEAELRRWVVENTTR